MNLIKNQIEPVIDEHCKRVTAYACKLIEELNLDKSLYDEILLSASIHDVGKNNLGEKVLNKPGKLNRLEFEHVKQHVVFSAEYAIQMKYSKVVVKDVLSHHEDYCGSGYLQGLSGQRIPLGARVIRICDYYDALTSERPYRGSILKKDALNIMIANKHCFDPGLFALFIKIANKL